MCATRWGKGSRGWDPHIYYCLSQSQPLRPSRNGILHIRYILLLQHRPKPKLPTSSGTYEETTLCVNGRESTVPSSDSMSAHGMSEQPKGCPGVTRQRFLPWVPTLSLTHTRSNIVTVLQTRECPLSTHRSSVPLAWRAREDHAGALTLHQRQPSLALVCTELTEASQITEAGRHHHAPHLCLAQRSLFC